MCDLFVFKKKSYASLAGKGPEGIDMFAYCETCCYPKPCCPWSFQ